MAETPLERLADYELIREIRRHPSGVTYEAATPEGAMVTVVVQDGEPDEDHRRIFEREALAMKEIRHPHLARVLDYGTAEGRTYVVEEAVQGVTLSDLLAQRRLSLPDALRVFKDLLAGLGTAHARGVVHRLLEPGQVVVSEDLTIVKLRGFCFGMPAQQKTGEGTMGTMATTRGMFSGLHYLAPEQAGNPEALNQLCNVYSLGVIFYELLTGRVPRGRFNLPSQLNPEVPSELDSLVMTCVATEPTRRLPDLEKVRTRFTAIEDQLRLGLVHELQGIQRSTAKILRSQGKQSNRRWVVWSAMIALLLLAGIVAAVLVWLPRG